MTWLSFATVLASMCQVELQTGTGDLYIQVLEAKVFDKGLRRAGTICKVGFCIQ